VPLKRHSKNLWRSIEELESLSGTWWRAKRKIWPSWRGLEPQWNRYRAWKKRTRRRIAKMIRKGPRMALGKVRRRGLHHLPSAKIVCFFFSFLQLLFCFL